MPLKPFADVFLDMMLMIPPVPDASCDASGLVMTSMLLMVAEGCVVRSLTVVGTPSSRTRMLEFPLMEILSLEMFTDDADLRMSKAVPLSAARLDPALSVVCSTEDFLITSFADTIAPSSEMASSLRIMGAREIVALSGVISCENLVYPMNSTTNLHSVSVLSIFSMNSPFWSVMTPAVGVEFLYIATDAYATGTCLSSLTFPDMVHFPFCACETDCKRNIVMNVSAK